MTEILLILISVGVFATLAALSLVLMLLAGWRKDTADNVRGLENLISTTSLQESFARRERDRKADDAAGPYGRS